MSSVAKQRLQALSQQLAEGIPSEGTFEDIPRIRHVAGDSTGLRVKGRVAIVTGTPSRHDDSRKLTYLQGPIVPSALVGQQHTNSPTTVLGLSTSATMLPAISKLINVSYNSSAPTSRSTYGNSMPGMKVRLKLWWMKLCQSMLGWTSCSPTMELLEHLPCTLR